MKPARILLWSLALTALVWFFFSWPLPRYVASGIPSSATNIEKGHVRRMYQGDHLQVLYTFWLTSDIIAGKTPFASNPYEFNKGNDTDRRVMRGDELPFSLLFTVVCWLFGRALAWNTVQFASLWLTFLCTWLLTRRYVREPAPAALAALVSIALPYRWTAMAGGSPMGYAMAWIPLMFLGIDMLIREGRLWGSLLASAAIFFAYWNDVHVLFFTLMILPCWGVLALIHGMEWGNWRRWLRVAVLGTPIAAMVMTVAALGEVKRVALKDTIVGRTRELREVMLFSPEPGGLLHWHSLGQDSVMYMGYVLPLILLIGLAAGVCLLLRKTRQHGRDVVVLLLLVAGTVVVIALALGLRGPHDAQLMLLARKYIPPYAMIRQPTKILCVLPPLLAVAIALSLNLLRHAGTLQMLPRILTVLLPVLLTLEYNLQVRLSICLVDKEQAAYRAVAEDARERRREEPHVLVLPLWPGDSSWASLYEHYVSLYRIRMINGYEAGVPKSYIKEVFGPLCSANVGLLTDAQLDNLRRRNIHYILLHEDAFPEKVSYFPVGFTLKRLLNHPRLQLLKQDRNVWAFAILDKPFEQPPQAANWTLFFPVMHFEMEWGAGSNAVIGTDAAAAGARFVTLGADGSTAVVPPFEHQKTAGASILLRQRGHGSLLGRLRFDDGRTNAVTVDCDSADWEWTEIPVGEPRDSSRVGLEFARAAGSVDLDMISLAGGTLPRLAPGESFALPAPLFFHAGYTDLAADCVRLRKDYEPAEAIFYGPKLPLFEAGEYRIGVDVESQAPAGTPLGRYFLETEKMRTEDTAVVAGRPDDGRPWSVAKGALPFTLRFVYFRNADVAIRKVTVTRVK